MTLFMELQRNIRVMVAIDPEIAANVDPVPEGWDDEDDHDNQCGFASVVFGIKVPRAKMNERMFVGRRWCALHLLKCLGSSGMTVLQERTVCSQITCTCRRQHCDDVGTRSCMCLPKLWTSLRTVEATPATRPKQSTFLSFTRPR